MLQSNEWVRASDTYNAQGSDEVVGEEANKATEESRKKDTKDPQPGKKGKKDQKKKSK